ncbi:hypothetical protein HDU93_004714 [Gonapodya sp. JEL0774]|nr:hypothetical protein HDU93_004714 [Gonapodya sp. JEL0774]
MPPTKVSSSKGGKHATKHQNKTAWVHNPKTGHVAALRELPIRKLCTKCRDIVEWKKRMGQYKPLTVPKKCVSCGQKSVKDAYHIICDRCAHEKQVCTLPPRPDSSSGPPLSPELSSILPFLPERHRRTVLRKLEKEEWTDAEALEAAEKLKRKGGEDDDGDLEFDMGSDDEDDEDDDDDDDEEEEEED